LGGLDDLADVFVHFINYNKVFLGFDFELFNLSSYLAF